MQCNKSCNSDASHNIQCYFKCSTEKWSKPTQSAVSSVASNIHPISTSFALSTMSSCATGKDACEWPLLTTDTLVDILFEFHYTGKTSGKTVRDTVWQKVQEELLKCTSGNYSVSQIKDKYKRLKKDWSIFHQFIISTNGVWNPVLFNIDLKPEELEKVKDNVEFKKAQKKGMRRYDVMTTMWAGGTAIGVFARSSNNVGTSVDDVRELSPMEYSLSCVGGSGGKKISGKRQSDTQSTYPATQSNSFSRRKVEDLQCAVMHAYLDETSVNGSMVTWIPEECLADVRLVDGVTSSDVVNAGAMFASEVNRNIYMNHTPEEKVFCVKKYCRQGGS